jgi:hypothetical protein
MYLIEFNPHYCTFFKKHSEFKKEIELELVIYSGGVVFLVIV